MAADNRNFVNKFANEGGGDVLVEDKRLEELKSATAKTSSQISTSTDYIPLQDTDGNLVKINAASFQEAVRNTLGGLLANNDKGTTISGIPALSGSGANLDFGSISPANLASVLGVFKGVRSLNENDNFDTLTNGIYAGNPFPNRLPTPWGMLLSCECNGLKVQVIFASNTTGIIYYRIHWASWGNWHSISFDN